MWKLSAPILSYYTLAAKVAGVVATLVYPNHRVYLYLLGL